MQEIDSMLRTGDVIAMVGDSITCDGRWWVSVREQVLARRPELRCDFRNCGIPGDSAGGALRRYEWDIAPVRPTLALVMFGMNDVWRDNYRPAPTEDMLTARARALEQYLVNMDALVARLLADGVRVVLLTPTPFDQYAPEPAENLPGVDDALAVCGGMTRGIAITRRLPVIDLHTPLRRRCASFEPLIGDDRVHPNDQGHAAMAELVTAAILPGDPVAVPPALRDAGRALHDAERPLRMIAMFRCWADGPDDAALLRYFNERYEHEQNPWVQEQMLVCRETLPQQAELTEKVAVLRRQLAEVVAGMAMPVS